MQTATGSTDLNFVRRKLGDIFHDGTVRIYPTVRTAGSLEVLIFRGVDPDRAERAPIRPEFQRKYPIKPTVEQILEDYKTYIAMQIVTTDSLPECWQRVQIGERVTQVSRCLIPDERNSFSVPIDIKIERYGYGRHYYTPINYRDRIAHVGHVGIDLANRIAVTW